MDSILGGFERAVAGTLDELEVGLLGRPQEFVGAVADLYDPDSAEVAVLYLHCTDELLRPFAEAARAGTTDALEQAARRVELWLHDVRRVDAGDAHSVAWGIARGVAAHLGVVPPRDSNGGKVEWDDATRAVANRAEAVLADAGATEEDVAVALAALRQLPAGLQGKTALETALERRLGKLRAEREAEEARRAEERLRREAEEREQEAARKRREEQARLVEEQEETRKAQEAIKRARAVLEDTNAKERDVRDALAALRALPAGTKGVDGLVTDLEKRLEKPKPWGAGAAVVVVVCLVAAIALFANLQNADSTQSVTATSAATKTQTEGGEGSVSGVEVRDEVSEYSWAELKELSSAISQAKDDEAGLKVAKEYNLVDSDGKLQGDTKSVKLTDGTKASVRILGFRHDDLAGGGKAGISFEFADVPAKHRMNAERTNSGGWEASEMRAWLNSGFLVLLPDDLRSCVELATKRTNNVGKVKVQNKGDTSVVTETDDRLWLLSMGEMFGRPLRYTTGKDVGRVIYSYKTYHAEGTQYQLYADQSVTTSNSGFCKKGGAHSLWWLRSPVTFSKNLFHLVDSNGDWSGYYAGGVGGVSPGFCF